MVQLRPGTRPADVVAALEDCVLGAESLLGAGTPVDRLNKYRTWSTRQIQRLRTQMAAASVEEIVGSRRYWFLQSLDPIAYGSFALGELIDLELAEAVDACRAAIVDLQEELSRWSAWGWSSPQRAGYVAIVIDTNVLMRPKLDLAAIDWWALGGYRPHLPVALGIPMTVVEELDRLKLATGDMSFRGTGKPIPKRTLARAALTWLDETFSDGQFKSQLLRRVQSDAIAGDLYAILMIDDLRRERVLRPDLDILDQATALRPFVHDVAIATHDKAMIFRARSLGLKAFRPHDD